MKLPGLGRRTPRLSVVVPVFNVEQYLAECLDSILAQDYKDLEILVVDDGSTDGSPGIAADYARRHRNLRVVTTENHGLGAARNTGVRHVEGELLAFVDSDDTLPPHAHRLLVSTLDETGSDFVVGSVRKRFADRTPEPPWLQRIHRERRLAIRIDDFPEVIHDVYAWNKVFRRTFWDRSGLFFPEGVRYEDQVAITEAYLRAEAIDVVRRPVYLWRQRDDSSSITQGRNTVADLEDRIATKQLTTRIVNELGSPRVRDSWYRQGLVGDLPKYLRNVGDCDDEYWDLLHRGLNEMFDGLPPIEESHLRAQMRLLGWLVTQGRRRDAERVMEFVAAHPDGPPLQVRGDQVVAELPFLDDVGSGVPQHVFRLAEHELPESMRGQLNRAARPAPG